MLQVTPAAARKRKARAMSRDKQLRQLTVSQSCRHCAAMLIRENWRRIICIVCQPVEKQASAETLDYPQVGTEWIELALFVESGSFNGPMS